MSDPRRQHVTAPPSERSFDEVVLPHLAAACRLAQYLMRNEHDAEDVVQEAALRALRYFRTFTGGNGRAWFLSIVRNTCRGWRGRRVEAATESFDEERHSDARPASDPETLVLRTDDVVWIERAMEHVPDRGRELIVLRELQGLSYRELADVTGLPMGTVMSTLSRARHALRGALEHHRTAYCGRARSRARERSLGGSAIWNTYGTQLAAGSTASTRPDTGCGAARWPARCW